MVRNQLSRAATDIRQHGYVPEQDVVISSLRDDASESVVVNLQAGGQYAIVGVCDQDCTDVDLRIYSPSGQQLDEDIETDDTPVVEFVAPVAGQYRLSVIMAACSQNPCFYGFQIFRRQGGK